MRLLLNCDGCKMKLYCLKIRQHEIKIDYQNDNFPPSWSEKMKRQVNAAKLVLENWCENNCNDAFAICVEEHDVAAYFDSEEDMMAVKLKWLT